MKNFVRVAGLVSTAILAAACSNQYTLSVDSAPRGALIVQNGGGSYSAAPQTVYYDTGNQYINPKTGCRVIRGFQARWKSGAVGSSPNPIELCGNGNAWNITIKRPESLPNLEVDILAEGEYLELQRNLQYELQRRALLEQQRQEEKSRARTQKNWSDAADALGQVLGCKIAGGCKR